MYCLWGNLKNHHSVCEEILLGFRGCVCPIGGYAEDTRTGRKTGEHKSKRQLNTGASILYSVVGFLSTRGWLDHIKAERGWSCASHELIKALQ